mgnify:CR=1 FL=1
MRSHSPRVHSRMVAAATIAIGTEIEMAVVTVTVTVAVAVAAADVVVVVAFVYPVQVDQWCLQIHNEVADLVYLDDLWDQVVPAVLMVSMVPVVVLEDHVDVVDTAGDAPMDDFVGEVAAVGAVAVAVAVVGAVVGAPVLYSLMREVYFG